jgi:hypothetical protein
MKFAHLLIPLLIFTGTGCDKIKSLTTNDVSLVKDNTLEFDKSITVGQAIDKYRYFKKTEWESIKEDNGRRIVQTTGYLDVEKHPDINKNKTPDLKSAFYRFQFIINLDKTLEIGWCGFGAEKTDGTKVEPEKTSSRLQCINTLKEVYANELKDLKVVATPEKNSCSEVSSSIKNAKTEMEAYFADNQKYPQQIPWTNGKPSDGVTVELVYVDNNKYSIKAYHPNCNTALLTSSDSTEITEQSK